MRGSAGPLPRDPGCCLVRWGGPRGPGGKAVSRATRSQGWGWAGLSAGRSQACADCLMGMLTPAPGLQTPGGSWQGCGVRAGQVFHVGAQREVL